MGRIGGGGGLVCYQCPYVSRPPLPPPEQPHVRDGLETAEKTAAMGKTKRESKPCSFLFFYCYFVSTVARNRSLQLRIPTQCLAGTSNKTPRRDSEQIVGWVNNARLNKDAVPLRAYSKKTKRNCLATLPVASRARRRVPYGGATCTTLRAKLGSSAATG